MSSRVGSMPDEANRHCCRSDNNIAVHDRFSPLQFMIVQGLDRRFGSRLLRGVSCASIASAVSGRSAVSQPIVAKGRERRTKRIFEPGRKQHAQPQRGTNSRSFAYSTLRQSESTTRAKPSASIADEFLGPARVSRAGGTPRRFGSMRRSKLRLAAMGKRSVCP